MENHKKIQSRNKRTLITLFLLILETILCAVSLLTIPSDPKNAFLFGLSKERLFLISGFGLILILLGIAVTQHRQLDKFRPALMEKPLPYQFILWCGIVALFLFLLPDYRYGKQFSAYVQRLKPYILWLALTLLTLSLSGSKGIHARQMALFDLSASRAFPIFFLFTLGLTFFMEITGLGKNAENALWNKNGIPLQSIQLFISIAAYALLRKIKTRLPFPKPLISFFGIWILSALVWSVVPFKAHFFAPGPYDPSQAYYPYSDAIAYDIPVFTALNGWGFNFHGVLLKPVVTYSAFISRFLAGDNYNLSMLIQSALYGILPAVIYLFGAAIGGTSCGILAALFSILKEWNALNSETVLTVHSRLVMSEFIMQIICAAYCYFIFRWLISKKGQCVWAAASGGIFALGIFTRYNFIAFLPSALLLIAIAYWKKPTLFLKSLLIFIIAIFATMAPWLIRSRQISGRYFPEIYDTFQRTLLNRRYQMDSAEGEAVIDTADVIYQGADSESGDTPAVASGPSKRAALIHSILNHSLHNFTASFWTLPSHLVLDDLEHIYQNDGQSLWGDDWNGSYTAVQWAFLIFWMVVISLVCAYLWKRFGIAGLSIPYFWLVYCFSIGISRSSGGRYVVPVNWVPMLLLALFIVLLFEKGTYNPRILPESEKWIPAKTIFVIGCFTAYFTSMMIFEATLPEKRIARPVNPTEPFQEDSLFSDTDWEQVQTQIQDGTMNVYSGNLLYPRFYYFRTGEHAQNGSFAWKEYSRLIFFGIDYTEGQKTQLEFLMPHTELIDFLPNGSEFHALSCTSDLWYEDVLALSVTHPDGSSRVYRRDPMEVLSCPIPEPICIGIENCH